MPKIQIIHDTARETPDEGFSYFHCQMCIDEMPSGLSPKEWARQQVALTPTGVQVWCTRHDVNIDSISVRIAE